MAISQLRSKLKATGGRYIPSRKKKLYELGRNPALTKLGERRIVAIRTKGNRQKMRLLKIDIANVFNPKSKQYKKAKIKTISENPANRHFIRRNIMTKGSIVETEIGKARITSKPGQHGTINAVLV